MFDLLPADRRDTARTALTSAFGRAPVTALRAVTGGASGALTYRVDVGDRAYLLRIEAARDLFRNPHRTYPCMRIAAEAGVAPALRHADPDAGIAIMDFLDLRPLAEHPGGPAGLARQAGELVARLQATEVFPPLGDYPRVLAGMLAMVRGGGVVAEGLLDPDAEAFERIREAYPWDGAGLVSSHNDPNPLNLLSDGQRLWLVDWETAFRNDPLADIAITVENFAATPELGDVLLTAWLGRAPDRLIRARLALMRQFARLYYACLIFSTFIGRRAPETDLTAPTVAEFQEAFAQGRLTAGGAETLMALAKMNLAGFRAGLAAPGFEEAIGVCGQA